MSSDATEDDLASCDDVDWLEHQFFNQTRFGHHDLDWGPVSPMPVGARRAMHAAFGMFAIAIVGFAVFVAYATLVMPVPVPIGEFQTVQPPSAASCTRECPERLNN